MIQEFENYKVGNLIQINRYEACALFWYTSFYDFFGKELPNIDECKKKSILWKLEAITEPQEITKTEKRHLFFLKHGRHYICVDPNYDPSSFCKANSYTLNYEKKNKQKERYCVSYQTQKVGLRLRPSQSQKLLPYII